MAQVLCQKVSFFTFKDKYTRVMGAGEGNLPSSAGSKHGGQLLIADLFHSERAPSQVGRSKVSWLISLF